MREGREEGLCEKQPDAAASHLIWSDFRYLVSSCVCRKHDGPVGTDRIVSAADALHGPN